MRTENIQRITLRIRQFHLQRILLPHQRIGQPEIDPFPLIRFLGKEPVGIRRIEIERLRQRDGIQRSVETYCQQVFLLAFRFQEILPHKVFLEQAQLDIIRKITSIANRPDRIDGQAVFPKRILPGSLFQRRDNDRVVESDLFAWLVELIIAVDIIQTEYTIAARRDITDGELSFVVRTRSTVERQFHKSRIFQVLMQTDRDTGHRFQVFRIQQDTGNFQRIDHITGREGKREILEHILLVIVGDRIGKVDRIGRILFQCIFQLDHHLLSGSTDYRQLHLRRCDDHILRRLIQLHQLIKQDFHLLPLIVLLVWSRKAADKFRRRLIIRSSVRRSHIGT